MPVAEAGRPVPVIGPARESLVLCKRQRLAVICVHAHGGPTIAPEIQIRTQARLHEGHLQNRLFAYRDANRKPARQDPRPSTETRLIAQARRKLPKSARSASSHFLADPPMVTAPLSDATRGAGSIGRRRGIAGLDAGQRTRRVGTRKNCRALEASSMTSHSGCRDQSQEEVDIARPTGALAKLVPLEVGKSGDGVRVAAGSERAFRGVFRRVETRRDGTRHGTRRRGGPAGGVETGRTTTASDPCDVERRRPTKMVRRPSSRVRCS